MPRPFNPDDDKTKREHSQDDDADRPTRGSQSEKSDKGYSEENKDDDAPKV